MLESLRRYRLFKRKGKATGRMPMRYIERALKSPPKISKVIDLWHFVCWKGHYQIRSCEILFSFLTILTRRLPPLFICNADYNRS